MATEAKDKVITVDLLGTVATKQKTYIDAAVKKVSDALEDLPTAEDLLEAATSEDIQDILEQFNVAG